MPSLSFFLSYRIANCNCEIGQTTDLHVFDGFAKLRRYRSTAGQSPFRPTVLDDGKSVKMRYCSGFRTSIRMRAGKNPRSPGLVTRTHGKKNPRRPWKFTPAKSLKIQEERERESRMELKMKKRYDKEKRWKCGGGISFLKKEFSRRGNADAVGTPRARVEEEPPATAGAPATRIPNPPTRIKSFAIRSGPANPHPESHLSFPSYARTFTFNCYSFTPFLFLVAQDRARRQKHLRVFCKEFPLI